MSEADLTELTIPETMQIEHEPETETAHEHERENDGERPLSARDEMMKLIAERREEAINKELRLAEDYAADARENAGLERELEPEVEREPAPELQLDIRADRSEPKTEPKTEPALRTINIDGQSFQVSDDQYRQLAEVGIRANSAMSRQPQPQDQPRQQEQPQERRQILSKEDADAVAERLLYGGKDQVAATLQAYADHIAQQSRQEHIDSERITAEATRRAVEQTQLQSDLQIISGEYPTLWAERIHGELAALQLSHIRQQDQATGFARSNLDAYREACNRTLDALGQPRPGAPKTNTATQAAAPTSASPSDRTRVLERKRVTPSQPTAVDRRASASDAPRAKTGSEIVEAMRKSRGQMAMT